MSNNVLALHFGHHGSVSHIVNYEVVFHTQMDRYCRLKNFGTISRNLLDIICDCDFDTLILTDINGALLPDYFKTIIHSDSKFREKVSKSKLIMCTDKHHIFHAYAMDLWSNDKDKKIFVMDGNGVQLKNNKFEQESLYILEKNKLKHQFTTHENIGLIYQQRSIQMFINYFSDGKLMALSNYGLTNKKYYNCDIIEPILENERIDYAKTTQKYCEDKVLEIFKKNIHNKNENIFLSGGVAQNVLLNSKIKKIFKNFEPDPICTDSGISLGAANFFLKRKIKKLNTPFLGIKQNLDLSLYNLQVKNCCEEDVVKIIQEDPVAIFQSRSEQGQRGLGNRSLLMSPLNKNCFKKLNEIKKREWFRPFALSILDEKGKEWFEDYFTSKYMKYVFKLKLHYRKKIYGGYAIDFTSRIQSVTNQSNLLYYNLLKKFNELTNCPCLINTSLNLPGNVLVETIDDLIYLLKKSKLKYVYLPEINKLIYNNK